MAYWRMQLHPSEPSESVKDCVESLAAGYIGLDFNSDVGDLMRLDRSTLSPAEKDYWLFAHGMNTGDWVLIIAHHFPFALANVVGPYNYMRERAPELGVWFRHFRKVDPVMYYADFITNAHEWEVTKMTDAISPLLDPNSASYRLIDNWLRAAGYNAAVTGR